MKYLYILRHGETEASHFEGDFHRELTIYGKNQLTILREKIASKRISPEQVLCSTATRTRQTSVILNEKLNFQRIEYLDGLYECDLKNLLNELQKIDNEVRSVLMIGHNPGLSALVSYLCGDFFLAMNPGDFVILSLEIDEWNFLTQDIAIIIDILR